MRFIVFLLQAMRLSVAVSALCFFVNSAMAEGHDCRIKEVEGVDDATQNANCLLKKIDFLAAQNRTLQDKISETEMNLENSVLIFDRPQGCPNGWTDMSGKWQGRMLVVGVADTNHKYGFGRKDGSETHTLTVEEMPSHNHGGLWGGDAKKAGMLNEWQYHTSGRTQIQAEGGGKPHNNMPPYVAVFFCKKGMADEK